MVRSPSALALYRPPPAMYTYPRASTGLGCARRTYVLHAAPLSSSQSASPRRYLRRGPLYLVHLGPTISGYPQRTWPTPRLPPRRHRNYQLIACTAPIYPTNSRTTLPARWRELIDSVLPAALHLPASPQRDKPFQMFSASRTHHPLESTVETHTRTSAKLQTRSPARGGARTRRRNFIAGRDSHYGVVRDY